MIKRMRAAVLAITVAFVAPGGMEPAAAASSEAAVHVSQSAVTNPTDISARHRVHRDRHYSPDGYDHHRYGYDRRYGPRYCARPYYYEPDPSYVPLPFGLGFDRWR